MISLSSVTVIIFNVLEITVRSPLRSGTRGASLRGTQRCCVWFSRVFRLLAWVLAKNPFVHRVVEVLVLVGHRHGVVPRLVDLAQMRELLAQLLLNQFVREDRRQIEPQAPARNPHVHRLGNASFLSIYLYSGKGTATWGESVVWWDGRQTSMWHPRSRGEYISLSPWIRLSWSTSTDLLCPYDRVLVRCCTNLQQWLQSPKLYRSTARDLG